MAPFTPELMALQPETFAERYLSAIGATADRGRTELPLRRQAVRRSRPARRARVRDPGGRRRFPVSRRRRSALHCGRETSARRQHCSGGRSSSTASSSPATSVEARSATRPRTSRSSRASSCPRYGIYAGSALGHRAAISIGTNPHYGGTGAPDRAVPARLRGRSLRQAARRRGVGAAARRRRCSRPRRSSSPRSAVTSRRPGLRRGRLRLPEPTQRDARRRGRPTPAPRRSNPPRAPRDSRRRSAPRRRRRSTWANACRKYVSYVSHVTYPRCGVASTASLATSGSAVAGSSSNTSTAALPGRPGGERSGERALLDQSGAGRVDEERVRLHQREVAGGDEPARLRRQLEVDADDVRALAEGVELRLGFVPVGGGALERRRASPGEHVHPERPSVAGDERADVPVADDPERASVQLPADRSSATFRREARRRRRRCSGSRRGSARASARRARTQTPSRCRPTIPRRVHSARSMWGIPRPVWQISLRLGRSASSGASIGVRSRIRTSASASPIWAARSATVSGRVGLHDHVVARREARTRRAARRPAGSPPSRRRASREPIAAPLEPGARARHRGRDPAWLLRFRLTLSRPAVSSFTPR